MKRSSLTLVVLGFIILLAVLTTPDQARHNEAISSKINSYIQKSIGQGVSASNDESEKALLVFGGFLGGALVSNLISSVVTTDNYVIFSTTKIIWQGETRVIGIGAFGNVFLTKKLDEALEKGLLTK